MKSITRVIFFVCVCLFVACSQKKAQDPAVSTKPGSDSVKPSAEVAPNPYAGVDVSPMDMSYFPVDYPKLKMAQTTRSSPLIRVIYSRPHLAGRKLFNQLLKYDQPWRLGANEATELQLFQAATIQGKPIKAGRYILYCIPHPDKWTIVFNGNVDSWGLQQDSTQDIAKFEIPVKPTTIRLESFTMVFEKIQGGAELVIAWDTIEARLPILFSSN